LAVGNLVAEEWEDINARDTAGILLDQDAQDFLEGFLHHAVAAICLTTTILMVAAN
tara:strand:- start:333 stop:500 length:168 start_codon:yes stop_codon:yes gene_type:complete